MACFFKLKGWCFSIQKQVYIGSFFQAAHSTLQNSGEDQARHGTKDAKCSMIHQQFSYIKELAEVA